MSRIYHRTFVLLSIAAALATLVSLTPAPSRAELPADLKAAEARRVEVVKKAEPAVVAVFNAGGQGGGSGVLIDENGYALTNFHVVEGAGITPICGLSDGVLYNAVLVGLDRVGDVALIKLLPNEDKDHKIISPKDGKFPYAKMGDSDKVKAGDWSFAMGNPFLLATDFTPTVTFGLVSGVNRYQYPSGLLLEYTACIQIDTSINPGNSGGPLFNLDGELIGINGRGSFEKRGRVNSGVGYAISINQIKHFEGQLRAGIDTDHASLGAVVKTDEDDEEDGILSKLTIQRVKVDSDVGRRGLDAGDEIKAFAGTKPTNVNEYKNVLGIYPRGFRVPMTFEHEEEKTKETKKRDILVRLEGVQKRELPNQGSGSDQPPPQQPPKINPKSPGAALYKAKPGYANWYFNETEREALLKEFRGHGDFSKLKGKWTIEGQAKLGGSSVNQQYKVTLEGDKMSIDLGGIPSDLEFTDSIKKIMDSPAGSGGLLMALHQLKQLLVMPNGDKTFNDDFSHGGVEPMYLYPERDPGMQFDWSKQRTDVNVLRTRAGAVSAKWFFAKDDPVAVAKAGLKPGNLAGVEVTVDPDADPCEVYFSDYRDVDNNKTFFPHKITVVFGDKRYGTFTVEKVTLK